jgi:hypothetical protein
MDLKQSFHFPSLPTHNIRIHESLDHHHRKSHQTQQHKHQQIRQQKYRQIHKPKHRHIQDRKPHQAPAQACQRSISHNGTPATMRLGCFISFSICKVACCLLELASLAVAFPQGLASSCDSAAATSATTTTTILASSIYYTPYFSKTVTATNLIGPSSSVSWITDTSLTATSPASSTSSWSSTALPSGTTSPMKAMLVSGTSPFMNSTSSSGSPPYMNSTSTSGTASPMSATSSSGTTFPSNPAPPSGISSNKTGTVNVTSRSAFDVYVYLWEVEAINGGWQLLNATGFAYPIGEYPALAGEDQSVVMSFGRGGDSVGLSQLVTTWHAGIADVSYYVSEMKNNNGSSPFLAEGYEIWPMPAVITDFPNCTSLQCGMGESPCAAAYLPGKFD